MLNTIYCTGKLSSDSIIQYYLRLKSTITFYIKIYYVNDVNLHFISEDLKWGCGVVNQTIFHIINEYPLRINPGPHKDFYLCIYFIKCYLRNYILLSRIIQMPSAK